MHFSEYSRRTPVRHFPRSRRHAIALAAVIASGAALAPGASAGLTPDLEQTLGAALPVERVPVIVTLREQADPPPGATPPQILRSLQRVADETQPGLLTRLGLSGARSYWIVNAISTRALPLEITLIAADPAVASVDLDPEIRLSAPAASGVQVLQAAVPNWGLDAIRAPQAWRETGTAGAGVRVGVIDTGVDARHPALDGKVVGWRDIVAGRPAPYDDHGHGTHTAGSVAGGSESAPLGVAPAAKLLAVKAIPQNGVGAGSDIMAAAEWLADPDANPATSDFPGVISNSWGEVGDANDAWFRPLLRRWRSLGIVPVFAAGNTGPRAGSLGSPSGYPESLSVGAIDRNRSIAPFSSRGPIAWQNRDGQGPAPGLVSKPDLAAPGVDVVSAAPGGGYRASSGTSMAAPHVAGVAALVRSANASLSGAEVERILRSTAADIAAPGRDNESGEGVVDALAATRQAAARPGAATRVQPGRRTVSTRVRPKGTVRLTVAQLRINRRIALTATARVARLETRLGTPHTGPDPVTAKARAPIRRLSADQMRLTQRISQSALRRASAAEGHVQNQAPVAVLASKGGPIQLSVRQLRINQRIAQAALRRVTRAEAMAVASGLIPRG